MIDYKSCSLLAPGATRASLDPYPCRYGLLDYISYSIFYNFNSRLTLIRLGLDRIRMAARTYPEASIDLLSIWLSMLAYVHGTTSIL